GDWDGDGDLDVLNHSENLTLFSNDGTNAFAYAAVVPTDMDAPGAGPADFDGDGNLDFCAARALAFGNGTFHSVLPFAAPGYAPTAAVPRDWEGDGDVDFLDTLGRVLVNDGTGSFSLTSSRWPTPAANHLYKDPVAIADFDGDGREDYLVGYFVLVPLPPPGMAIAVFEEMRLLRDDGVGGYVDAGAAAPAGAQILAMPGGQMRLPVADLDGDGDLDLLVGGAYRPNSGTGFFATSVPLYSGNAIDAGDVDADGDPDVLTTVVPPSQQVSLVLQRNLGGLAFSAQTLFTAYGLDPRAHFLDLDGDGDLDAAAGYASVGNQLPLLENVGGSFAPVVTLPAAPFTTQVIAAGDVDGDGLRDVVTGPFDDDPNGERVSVFRRIGPGLVYQPRVGYLARVVRDFPDLDGDGDLDVSGLAMAFGWAFDGPSAGAIRQYGAGVAGTGGAVPVLGARGPLRPGSTSATVRLRRGLGGSPALLAVGTAEASLPNVPFPGMTTYVGGVVAFVPFTALGAPGVAGAGSVDIPIPIPILAVLTNASVFLQAALLDPAAPSFVTATNGLELHVGN
ncbi:MAG TPA: VCBS repeat-containing protein, partial [Planctomycetota bacterium]|nr:VCBS repeat-containing protein [Planctomycetota bacterium]